MKLINADAVLVILIYAIVKECEETEICSCDCFKKKVKNEINYTQNQYNYQANYVNNPVREVIIDNKPSIKEKPIDKPVANNVAAPNPITDLGVPPNVFQGSNSKGNP